ncbi:MAG: hypothetical protein ACI9HE_003408 [Planctomycetota bacterium]
MRFVDAKGADIIPRKDRVWALGALVERTTMTLLTAKREIPAWLAILTKETAETPTETLALSMHCFWDGEGKLGAFSGILSTRAAFVGGAEVVELRYDPRQLPLVKLVEQARALGCARAVHTGTQAQADTLKAAGIEAQVLARKPRRAPASDQLRHLSASLLKYLPLTPLQAQRVNAHLAAKKDASSLLSPRQLELFTQLRKSGEPKQLVRPGAIDELAAYEIELRRALQAK